MAVRKYREYTDEQFKQAVASCNTLAAVLRAIGLRPAGGNYYLAKQRIKQLGLDTSHFVGQAWMGGKYKPFGELTKTDSIKKHLLRERGHQCEICCRKTWLGQQITIELDHINGDRTDNDKDNLRLICPNCHSQTPTWKNRKTREGVAK